MKFGIAGAINFGLMNGLRCSMNVGAARGGINKYVCLRTAARRRAARAHERSTYLMFIMLT